MLFKPLFQRAVFAHLATFSARRYTTAATMTTASPPQSFTLDRTIFNPSLYSQIRNFWYDGHQDSTEAPPFSVMQKWFGIGKSDSEKAAFDNECRSNFEQALNSIGPDYLALPPFKDYQTEVTNADTIAAPFVAEIRDAEKEDKNKARDTLLSLVLLLDQMPRNIYRDPDGLKLVYKFYDRLAFGLIRSTLASSPELFLHENGKSNIMRDMWIWMPMLHSEHAESHVLARKNVVKIKAEAEEANDESAIGFANQAIKSYDDHWEAIDKFGRYPHRNECLERENTEEEDKYLETAETFGVKQTKKKTQKEDGKDEL